MKRNYLRLVSLLTAVLMLMGLLGACKGRSTATASQTKKSTLNQTSPKQSSAAIKTASSTKTSSTGSFPDSNESVIVPEDESISNDDNIQQKSYNLEGRNIRIYAWDQIPQIPSETNTGTNEARLRYKFLLEAEEKFNCKFTFIHNNIGAENYHIKVMNNFISGIDFADAFWASADKVFPAYEKRDLVAPLNPYIDLEKPVWKMLDYRHPKGMIHPEYTYAFATVGLGGVLGIWYNIDILNRAGIPNLHDYADAGIWNWDTFTDVARKTTQDLNGDGSIEQWGISTTPENMGQVLLSSNGINYILKESSNPPIFKFILNDPKSLRALQYMSELYSTYNVMAPAAQFGTVFLKGSAAMMTQYNHRGQNYFKANNMINLGFEAPPEGPDMINHNYVYFAGGNHIYYPSYLKDKEEVMNAVSYWWSIWDSEKEGSWSFDDIIQSQLGEVLYSERDLLANRRAVKNQQLMQFGNFPELKGLMDQNVFKKIVNREVSVTSAVESIMQQAQTHIDSIIQK